MRKTLILACLLAVMTTALSPGVGSAQPGVESGPARCEGGEAAGFPCKKIDLESYLPSSVFGNARIADVWGWADPETGKEYALLGSTTGMHFVDVTIPSKPIYLGRIALKAEPLLIWQEIEVYKDHAFVVCDLSPCGLQIFDLTRLRGVKASQVWTPDLIYPIPFAHSIDLNPETGFLYVNGTGTNPASAQHMVDVNNPKVPIPAGFTYDDGYTHDSLCRNYKGPDKNYNGHEICFNFNTDSITTYDMTNKMGAQQLSKVTYDGVGYVHSGTLVRDDTYLISTDEGDEDGTSPATLFIWDVSDLTAPELISRWRTSSPAIDHNVFTLDDLVYHANYTAGLRVYKTNKIHKGKLKEIAYFDIVPLGDSADFDGAWAIYPYLPSGTILVGGMGQGLAIVTPTF